MHDDPHWQSQRAVYWQAMREACRELRRTPPHMTEWWAMYVRLLTRYHAKWREAYEATK